MRRDCSIPRTLNPRGFVSRRFSHPIISSSQVSEMRCGLKGQITKALSFADSVNIHLDLISKSRFPSCIPIHV
jgi:hypothetical protein